MTKKGVGHPHRQHGVASALAQRLQDTFQVAAQRLGAKAFVRAGSILHRIPKQGEPIALVLKMDRFGLPSAQVDGHDLVDSFHLHV